MNQVSPFVYPPSEGEPKTARGRRTRQKILQAAEKEFGERGFHAAAINRITDTAGVAMGTFYVHFESKEAIFQSMVSHISRHIRRSLSVSVAGVTNRLEAERLGLKAYIEFVRKHPNIYRIIDEAQFVAPDAYKAHYSKFVDAYKRHLVIATDKGEIKPGQDEARAWALIGISVFLGMRYGVWDTECSIDDIATGASDLIEFGLQPEK